MEHDMDRPSQAPATTRIPYGVVVALGLIGVACGADAPRSVAVTQSAPIKAVPPAEAPVVAPTADAIEGKAATAAFPNETTVIDTTTNEWHIVPINEWSELSMLWDRGSPGKEGWYPDAPDLVFTALGIRDVGKSGDAVARLRERPGTPVVKMVGAEPLIEEWTWPDRLMVMVDRTADRLILAHWQPQDLAWGTVWAGMAHWHITKTPRDPADGELGYFARGKGETGPTVILYKASDETLWLTEWRWQRPEHSDMY